MLTPEKRVAKVTPVSPPTGIEVKVVGASSVTENRAMPLGRIRRAVTVAIPPLPPVSFELSTVSPTLVVMTPDWLTTIWQYSVEMDGPLANGIF